MLLFSAVPVLRAGANIGDDLDQLRRVYGSAKVVGGEVLFQHDGYSICVYFDANGKSAMEVFVRDGSQPQKKEITTDDMQKLLTAQGEGRAWSTATSRTGELTWVRSDNRLMARFDSHDNVFFIMLNKS